MSIRSYETYNDAMDCCVEEDGRKKVKRNQVCEASEEEEGSDERYVKFAYAMLSHAKKSIRPSIESNR